MSDIEIGNLAGTRPGERELRCQSLLLVEAEAPAAERLKGTLQAAGLDDVTLEIVSSPSAALDRMARQGFDVLLMAVSSDAAPAGEWVRRIAQRAGRVPVVLLLDRDDRELGIAAIRAGVQDVVVKDDLSPGDLGRVVTYAIERRRIFDKLSHLAFHDFLTGVPNRLSLRKRLNRSLERFHLSGKDPFSLILLDLNGFKQLNDSRGHAAGDEVLVLVAKALEESVRPRDLVARIGGDEFAVLVEGEVNAAELRTISERIQGCLAGLCLKDGSPAGTSASMGIVDHRSYPSAQAMLRAADRAMYEAKRKGVSYCFAPSV